MIGADMSKLRQQAWRVVEPKVVALVMALLEAFKFAMSEFLAYGAAAKQQANLKGITIVLERYLNELFDAVDLGIVISSATASELQFTTTFIDEPVLFYADKNDVPVVFGSGLNGYDFVVTVPDGILTAAQELQIKAVVKKYTVAGFRPIFKYVSGTEF